MGSKKKQCYVVVNGRKPGIYTSWLGEGGAAEQVAGFPGAKYKGFYSREEAMDWLTQLPGETLPAALPSEEPEDDDLISDRIIIYTDGGARTNPGIGGYGVVLKHKAHRKELSGGFRLTTNNRMEILACIEGLRALKRKSDVVLFSDSQYVVNSMSKGWARRWKAQGWMRKGGNRAENPDLWQQLLDLCDYHKVEFRWLKGHNGTAENERCDQLATEAAKGTDLAIDTVYESPKPQQPSLPYSTNPSIT